MDAGGEDVVLQFGGQRGVSGWLKKLLAVVQEVISEHKTAPFPVFLNNNLAIFLSQCNNNPKNSLHFNILYVPLQPVL